MTPPIRIQRKRTKGFSLQAQSPDGRQVISVTRPGKWGNPFKCVGDQIFIHSGHRRKIFDPWILLCFGKDADAVRLYELTLLGATNTILEEFGCDLHDVHWHMEKLLKLNLADLSGKHLACFCPIGSHCHADTLISLANQ